MSVKVFSSGKDPNDVGDYLTDKIHKWQENANAIIQSVQVTSNNYGWMIVVTYESKGRAF